ncbi:extracellular solute-binding protein [Chelativorans sp. AA-79]|uniref:ABC transporter substrate-binding protein n=1 Tax=Chelativorans sp. AA-79 TaxID=3028735 RepID=UPI0023F86D56|nr:extracellular solute-binding protein [Chelativorans sp. AA-79]WEX08674.1 extracellular solute-binding protein [Chelativorans sp. AA-79]
MRIGRFKRSLLSAAIFAVFAAVPAQAQDSFLDVGQQEPITILINSSPWYAGFEAVVGLYEEQTGNQVELDVTPFGGMLEKARNAVRGAQSPQDILNIDAAWTIEFYEGGFLKPLAEIEPSFELPENVYTCGDSYYWNEEKRWRTSEGGVLLAVPPNCNTHVLVYRKDLFDQAALSEPKTYEDVLQACETLQDEPRLYGFVTRGERGNGIRFDWMPFMLGYDASIVADPENGDYTVTINSPEAKQALDKFIEIMTTCGPDNIAAIGQADMIQLMAAGKVAMAQSVIAAWSNFQDPTKSAVAGKVAAAVNPAPEGKDPGVVMGNWHFAVPNNIPEARQKAALAFMKWFLTKEAQTAYAEAGGIPVRSDVLTELSSQPEYAWMKAYNESMQKAQQVLGYAEGAEVEQVIGLRLNQALIGEMSSAAALNAAAREIHAIFQRTGRNTGMLEPLPE